MSPRSRLVTSPEPHWTVFRSPNSSRTAVYHYTPFEHALELRAELSGEAWLKIVAQLPPNQGCRARDSIAIVPADSSTPVRFPGGSQCSLHCQIRGVAVLS
jgi:hypothetical protein